MPNLTMSNLISRRNTLKLLAASMTATGLGYWAQGKAAVNALVANSHFNTPQQNTVVAVTDTLIPKTEFWGAVELGVPLYLVAWFDQCLQHSDRENIANQLDALETRAQAEHKKTFADCSQNQREQLLLTFAHSQNETEKTFFELFKGQCIHGFKTTKEVMTGPYRFRIVPGHFKGCVDINGTTIT